MSVLLTGARSAMHGGKCQQTARRQASQRQTRRSPRRRPLRRSQFALYGSRSQDSSAQVERRTKTQPRPSRHWPRQKQPETGERRSRHLKPGGPRRQQQKRRHRMERRTQTQPRPSRHRPRQQKKETGERWSRHLKPGGPRSQQQRRRHRVRPTAQQRCPQWMQLWTRGGRPVRPAAALRAARVQRWVSPVPAAE